MLSHKNLISWSNIAIFIDPPLVDRHHTVDGGQHDDEDGAAGSFHDDWAPASLYTVQAHYYKFSQWRLEYEEQDYRHFGEYHSKQHLDHSPGF